jgi:hypothetical protein
LSRYKYSQRFPVCLIVLGAENEMLDAEQKIVIGNAVHILCNLNFLLLDILNDAEIIKKNVFNELKLLRLPFSSTSL